MIKLLAVLLAPLLFSNSNIQNPTLQLGTPVERELAANQVHEFTVNLAENNYIQLVVEQHGIDVIVKVFSPAGKPLGEYDSPNGDEGPEHVSFVALDAGTYQVTVAPLEPREAKAGRYQIKVLELRQATGQELKTSRNFEVVKARGIALLTEIEEIIPQIKLPQTRIRAHLQTARLLWNTDEKRAAKSLANAITELKEFVASVDPNEHYYQQFAAISQLRHEIVQLLALRDPDAALAFLRSTNELIDPSGNQREHLMQELALELSIAQQIIKKDPDRALEIARRSLKKGYPSTLIGIVSQLRPQHPEVAAELANEIATKLLDEKLLKSQDAALLAINLIRFARGLEKILQVQTQNRPAQAPALLTEDRYRELCQKVLSEALSFPQPVNQAYSPERDAAWNMLSGLQQLSPMLDSIISGASAAVAKKISELSAANAHLGTPEYQKIVSNNPVQAALESIQKMPSENREQLYIELANREMNKGEVARARQIVNDHVTSRYRRVQSLKNIEQHEILIAMHNGKVEEALRSLGAFRNPRERADQLAQIANQIGPGHKRATALYLLEQVRSLLSPSLQAEDQEQMNALFEIARAFSRYDSTRAFDIIDPLIEQFNELCAAARTLDGFGTEYYEGEELELQNGSALAGLAGQMSAVLGSLAVVNFDRAKSASDRIRAPEVRLKAYMDIAQQTIQAAK